MSIHREIELYCDGRDGATPTYDCATPSIFADTAVRARVEAHEAGWLVGLPGGKDYCPEHRPEHSPRRPR